MWLIKNAEEVENLGNFKLIYMKIHNLQVFGPNKIYTYNLKHGEIQDIWTKLISLKKGMRWTVVKSYLNYLEHTLKEEFWNFRTQ